MSGMLAAHLEWLEARGIDVETAVRHSLTSRGPGIAIPYVVQGRQLYAKIRDPADKSRTRCVPSGVDQVIFWNETCLEEAPGRTDPLIITEGEFDALVMLQLGFQFVVSMPSGAASTEEGCMSKALRVLTRPPSDGKGPPVLRAEIERFSRVVVLSDGDHDGVLLRQAIVSIIGEQYCWVPSYPVGAKDANEVLVQHGAEAARDLVDRSVPVKHDGFVDFITAEKQNKPLRALDCGLPYLQPHFAPVRPSLVVVGGQAGHGKSSCTQALVFNLLWRNNDLRASIFHAEGDKTIPVQRAKKFWKGKTRPIHMTDTEKRARDEWVGDRLAYISPPQDEPATFEWLLWAMERQALYRKRNVFVLDPWNQIIHDAKRMSNNKTDYIGECIYRMKRLADRLGLILIVAHHTTKAIDPHVPPNRYSLADSAHWVNAADHLILCWKHREGVNLTRIEVAKSKDHDKMGRPGTVWVSLSADEFGMYSAHPPAGYERDGDTGAPPPPPAQETAPIADGVGF